VLPRRTERWQFAAGLTLDPDRQFFLQLLGTAAAKSVHAMADASQAGWRSPPLHHQIRHPVGFALQRIVRSPHP
jgi:hypothetical protein